MARSKRYSLFYNFILVIGVLLVAVLGPLKVNELTSVGLDQEARCGQTEHIHGQDCYYGEVLLCDAKAHVHSNDCYLLLLKDNDINWLLKEVEGSQEKSLEGVLTATMAQLDSLGMAVPLPDQQVYAEDIQDLNSYISETETYSPLVLNANIAPEASVLMGAISTYGVGSEESTNEYTANIYIYLDGDWTHKGTLAFTIERSERNYYRIIKNEDLLDFLNTLVDPDYTELSGSVNLFYTTNTERWNRGSKATVETEQTTFGSSRQQTDAMQAFYIRVVDSSANRPDDTTLKFYTVTYDYNYDSKGSYATRIVRSGTSLTPPADPEREGYTFTGWYTDAECTQAYDFDDTVSGKLTLYAGWERSDITVTWEGPSGTTQESKTPVSGQATFDVPELADGWIWVKKGTTARVTAAQVTVSEDTTYQAVPAQVTVTYKDQAGNTIGEAVTYNFGTVISVDAPPQSYVWVGSDGKAYAGGESLTLTSDMTFTASQQVRATFVNADGSTYADPQLVTPGGEVTLPELTGSYVWIDQDGNEYPGGEKLAIAKNTEFTRSMKINIVYDVNFPTSIDGETFYPSGGVGADPTLLGISPVGIPVLRANSGESYTISDFTMTDAPHTAENLNYREVFYYLNDGDNRSPAYETRSVYFKGWQVTVGDETLLIEPGQRVDWALLESIAEENSGTVSMEGLWETNGGTTVTFYVNYEAKATNASGNYDGVDSGAFTPEVFCGHLFGLPAGRQTNIDGLSPSNSALYGISGATATTSVDADQKIRQLYGQGIYYDGTYTSNGQTVTEEGAATTLYMTDFPTDAEVLAKIKKWAESGALDETLQADNGDGTADDVPYTTDSDGNKVYYDLDADHYTIRWYVFKSQSDGWHVDGRLIKKVGTVKVTKAFGGNASLVEQAIAATEAYGTETPFITAACAGYYKTVDGVTTFETYATPRTEKLYFFESTASGDGGYTYDAQTDTYSWTIENVEANEEWVVTEFPATPQNSLDLSEWIWVDSFNGTSDTGVNTSTTVTGITHAADSYSADWLTVDFTNVYHKENTILVRKVDGNTMQGLPGAVFNLYQLVDGQESLMYFTYDDAEQIYTWSPENEGVTDLTVNQNGFLEYTVSGFSYDAGNIIVREKTPPSGYAVVGDVTVGYLKDSEGNFLLDENNNKIIGIIDADGNDAAEYQNGVLTVKNYSDGEASVTAQKVWDCDKSYYDGLAVCFELWANGQVASATIPGFAQEYGSYYVYLDAAGAYVTTDAQGNPQYIAATAWSYTWSGLPTVISGQAITYTIVETQVGEEAADSSGNFPNWIQDEMYNTVTTDDEGNQTVTIAIRNTPDRALIRLTKYALGSSTTIPGAVFTIQEVNGTVSITDTTDEYGVITFDNLKYETWYALTEDSTPVGYIGFTDTVYIWLAENGVVTVTTDMTDTSQAHEYVFYPNQANNISAYNIPVEPLPETGGVGSEVYKRGGLLLMLAAAALLLYRRMSPGPVPAGAEGCGSEAGDLRDPGQRLPGWFFPKRLRQNATHSPPEPVPRGLSPPHRREETDSS